MSNETIRPIWAQIGEIKHLTGLPDGVIRSLVNSGKVGARKSCDARNAVCVYFVDDVLAWLQNEAPKPDTFKVPESVERRMAV